MHITKNNEILYTLTSVKVVELRRALGDAGIPTMGTQKEMIARAKAKQLDAIYFSTSKQKHVLARFPIVRNFQVVQSFC